MSVEVDKSSHSKPKSEKKSKRNKRKWLNDENETHVTASEAAIERLKKSASFSQAAQQALKQSRKEDDERDIEMQDVDAEAQPHDLLPIPQPSVEDFVDSKPSVKNITSVLPKWLAEPITVDPNTTVEFSSLNISSKLVERLQKQNITRGFAVQAAVLPLLLQDGRHGPMYSYGGDVCVSAATGSGKTLSYVIPIVQCLSHRTVPRLRCVVIVPTRELTVQVAKTFEYYMSGAGLQVCAWTGQKSLRHETYQLNGDENECRIDVLVSTPGRLVDHIRNDESFSLQHLRYMVIDEADRLLDQSFQDWVDTVMMEISHPKCLQNKSNILDLDQNISPTFLPDIDTLLPYRLPSPLQKLVFSATLTRDPSKIASLKLHNPRLVLVQNKDMEVDDGGEIEDDAIVFSVPPTLQEYHVSVSSEKPILLYHLIHSKNLTNILCFVKSNEAAARLHRLLELIHESLNQSFSCGLFTSSLSRDERKKIISRFATGDLNLLVCSDLMARGIDVANTQNVINYDPPLSVRSYVHRIGRTARAGREGFAWTLVQSHEGHHFSKLVKQLRRTLPIKRIKIEFSHISEEFVVAYDKALEALRVEVFNSRYPQQKSFLT
ncbi:ATP-dependent RNA helicase dbp6 [Schizosaccharomyces pombe]